MKECPVCETELDENIPEFCDVCAWDLGEDITLQVFLDMPSHEDIEEYRKKLEKARKIYNEKYFPKKIEFLQRLVKIKKFSIEKESETVLFHTRKLVEIILEDVFINVCSKKPPRPTIETLFEGIRHEDRTIFTGIIETVIKTLQIRCNQAYHEDYGLVERQVLLDLYVLIKWYIVEFKKYHLNQELKEKIEWLKEV